VKNGDYFKGRRVLVTGASSGIGAAVARLLARYGAVPILVGRDLDRLTMVAEACGPQTHFIAGDLTDPIFIQGLGERLNDFGVDIAILNAGIAAYDSDGDFSPHTCHRIFQTNVGAVVDCIGLVLPILKRTHGQLVLMSSIAGYGGLPHAASYCASKAAVRALGQSLDLDLRPLGVPVTVICPGFVKTPLTDLNQFSMPFIISDDNAATEIAVGIAERRHEVHFPRRLSLLLKLVTSLPAGFQYQLLRWATRPKRQGC